MEVTNANRADRANVALDRYAEMRDEDELTTLATDLIADLLHLCAGAGDDDPRVVMENSWENFTAESTGRETA